MKGLRAKNILFYKVLELAHLLASIGALDEKVRSELGVIDLTQNDVPEFVYHKGKYYQIPVSRLKLFTELLDIPPEKMLEASPDYLLFLLRLNHNTILNRIHLYEKELGLPWNRLKQAHPNILLFFLGLDENTVLRKIRTLEQREGKNIQELAKTYTLNTLIFKILRAEPSSST
jgi:hypothetical protein